MVNRAPSATTRETLVLRLSFGGLGASVSMGGSMCAWKAERTVAHRARLAGVPRPAEMR